MLQPVLSEAHVEPEDASSIPYRSRRLSRLSDLECISRRCPFVRAISSDLQNASHHDALVYLAISRQTKNAAQAGEAVERFFPDSNSGEGCGVRTQILANPTCEWIEQNSNCGKCGGGDFCGVVTSPVEFGRHPWDTDKRILIHAGDLDEEVLICEGILKNYSEVFFQGDRLVRAVGNRLKVVHDTNRAPLEIQPLSSANLQEIISANFAFLKLTSSGWVQTYPMAPLVRALLERANYPSLKHLRAITEFPALREDGTILQAAGYDPQSELLFDPAVVFPPIPERPTREQVDQSVACLLEVVEDFPFTSDLGKAVFLATILTIIGRFAFRGCVPMVLIGANTPGAGKSKLADVIGIITSGQPLPRAGQMRYEDEERRQITSMLLKGQRVMLIDNVAHRLGGPVLDMLLTSELWSDRILGRSKQQDMPNLLQVIATGNNLQLKADTVRRCIQIELSTNDEHPERRSGFKHADLEGWVKEHQPELLAAALTILRGYFAEGCPPQAIASMGSFSGWSSVVQSSVKWAYGIDPGEARVSPEDSMDLNREILERLVRGWKLLVPNGKSATARAVMDAVARQSEGSRDILESLEMAKLSNRSAVDFGTLLGRFKNRVFEDVRFEVAGRTSEGRLWRLLPVK